jgi:hypothetical protein
VVVLHADEFVVVVSFCDILILVMSVYSLKIGFFMSFVLLLWCVMKEERLTCSC